MKINRIIYLLFLIIIDLNEIKATDHREDDETRLWSFQVYDKTADFLVGTANFFSSVTLDIGQAILKKIRSYQVQNRDFICPDLPVEIWQHIFSYIPYQDTTPNYEDTIWTFNALRLVNKHLNDSMGKTQVKKFPECISNFGICDNLRRLNKKWSLKEFKICNLSFFVYNECSYFRSRIIPSSQITCLCFNNTTDKQFLEGEISEIMDFLSSSKICKSDVNTPTIDVSKISHHAIVSKFLSLISKNIPINKLVINLNFLKEIVTLKKFSHIIVRLPETGLCVKRNVFETKKIIDKILQKEGNILFEEPSVIKNSPFFNSTETDLCWIESPLSFEEDETQNLDYLADFNEQSARSVIIELLDKAAYLLPNTIIEVI